MAERRFGITFRQRTNSYVQRAVMTLFTETKLFLAEALGKTGKHVKNVATAEKRQQFMFQCHNGNQFYSHLAKAMVRSNIPLKKPAGENFCGFLEKWCGRACPSESTL